MAAGFVGGASVRVVQRTHGLSRTCGRPAYVRCARVSARVDAESAPGGADRGSAVFPEPLPVSSVWELDFYSRPVVGADGKKLWELIITDKLGNFEHVESIPNSIVNSKELRRRVQAVIDSAQTKPKVIRFFRAQMQNMIKIALSGFNDILVAPSRRTYSLFQLIEEREKNVYPKMPGYQKASADPFTAMGAFEVQVPEKMPDSLRGEKYAFVSLNLEQLRSLGPDDLGFGELCPIPADLGDDVTVPGICIYSKRAQALAGWLSGSELASMSVLIERKEVLMECGLNTNYLFARINQPQREDSKAFEKQKASTGGLHFLAVQTRPDDEAVAGFWLLRTL
mmetsp:Transcript_6613/g.20014  ORF Transcript_6613/g.20014 Transcript_6613/m.20014 type:complete len:339 (+) Transcript_6613:61-1077(+)